MRSFAGRSPTFPSRCRSRVVSTRRRSTALLAESGARVRTYSLGFAGEDDELPLARALAERWGTDHHEAVVDADELLDDLLQMVWSLDEPYGGGLPSWYVYRFMAEDVKVGLTGTGGDELFGNYRRFVPFERARLRALRRGDVRRYHFEPSLLLHRRGEARARRRRARTPRRCCSASTTRAAARARATRCCTSTSRRSSRTSSCT